MSVAAPSARTPQVSQRSARRARALLPERLRRVRRPRWWEEIAFIGGSYALYSLIRDGVPTHRTAAFAHAGWLFDAERAVHLDPERSVNRLVASVHWLAVGANYYYSTLHFVVTIGVLVWLYRRHALRYRAARTALYATTLLGLLGFWLFPVAPPRMLASHGFVDTIVRFHTWGGWASGDVAKASNQYAAMPSLHIAWSLWCATVLLVLARRTWVRVLACAYPVATLFVILGTANHFVLDAAGGLVTFALGFAVQRALSGRSAFAATAAVGSLPAQRGSARAVA